MGIEVKGKTIAPDAQGHLVNPGDGDEDVAEVLIKQHETADHKNVTETGWELIGFVREYYEDHPTHPTA